MKVLVVGGNGMLGSVLVSVLGRNAATEVYATFRTPGGSYPQGLVKKWFMFRSGQALPPSVHLSSEDWIVNAAGAIPHREKGAVAMIQANALLPHELAEVCERTGARLINVTTDCVFSGERRSNGLPNCYKELDQHDSRQLYGRTKSLGEVLFDKRAWNLRCSIVGPEPGDRSVSLLEWFLAAARQHKRVVGYKDHLWNGVTTLALAKVIEGIILYDERAIPCVQHLVPKGCVSKAELLSLFAKHFDVQVEIDPKNVGGERPGGCDRTLGTSSPAVNNKLWALAGYEDPPTIEEMVEELARWVRSGNYAFRKEAQA